MGVLPFEGFFHCGRNLSDEAIVRGRHRFERCLSVPNGASTGYAVARPLHMVRRLPGQESFIDGDIAAHHQAVERRPLAGVHDEPLSGSYEICLLPCAAQTPDLTPAEIIELRRPPLDLLPRPCFHVSPEENEDDEHRGRIEVKVGSAGRHTGQAVDIGGEGPAGDQGVHRGRPVEERCKSPLQDRQSGIEKDEGRHDKDRVREAPDYCLRHVDQTVKDGGSHHDVAGKDCGDGQPDLVLLPLVGAVVPGRGQPVS